jgi:ABC-type phosphate transport system substrate-binding protein
MRQFRKEKDMRKSVLGTALCTAALAGVVMFSAGASTEMRLNGSSTLAKLAIEPNRSTIEQKIGEPLKLTTSGSGKGLKDLVAGKVLPGLAVAQPMALISRGAPRPAQQKLIAAVGEITVAGK